MSERRIPFVVTAAMKFYLAAVARYEEFSSRERAEQMAEAKDELMAETRHSRLVRKEEARRRKRGGLRR